MLVLVKACPPRPRSQPRPAPAPLFCAAPSRLECPRPKAVTPPPQADGGGQPSSKGASLCRRRLRRREGRGVGSGPVLASVAGRSGLRGCVILPLCQIFTNVIHICKPVWQQRAPRKVLRGFSPSPPSIFPQVVKLGYVSPASPARLGVAPRRPLAAGMPAAKGRYTPAAGGRGRAAQQQGGKLRPQAALAPRGNPQPPQHTPPTPA